MGVLHVGQPLVASLQGPALLAERMRLPGTGGESRSDVATFIGIKGCGLAWIVLMFAAARCCSVPLVAFSRSRLLASVERKCQATKWASFTLWLLQFRVLRLGLFKDGDVRVSVFPESEEALIRCFCFGRVA